MGIVIGNILLIFLLLLPLSFSGCAFPVLLGLLSSSHSCFLLLRKSIEEMPIPRKCRHLSLKYEKSDFPSEKIARGRPLGARVSDRTYLLRPLRKSDAVRFPGLGRTIKAGKGRERERVILDGSESSGDGFPSFLKVKIKI